ncbi:J domain-containing protein isoform X4 [Drosophila busckii]|uniref:J domain-containing protein isoform X4 n=1 Tax=Drosophila busckii TaxID=30019 RepID=UPI00083EDD2B|nr:J domain-containing protein isoform X4 [Drosophila busckii]
MICFHFWFNASICALCFIIYKQRNLPLENSSKMSAVDAIINYKRNPNEDYYKLLHCDETSSPEQIQAEYKALALQYHPDKNAGDKEAEAKFQSLKAGGQGDAVRSGEARSV